MVAKWFRVFFIYLTVIAMAVTGAPAIAVDSDEDYYQKPMTESCVNVEKPVETPKPTKAPKPVEAETPVEAPKPIETSKPIEAEKSVETPKPVETEKPVEAPKPIEVEKPVETPRPVEAETLYEAPMPVETPKPIETLITVEVETPVETPIPVETKDAEDTVEPTIDNAPVQTEEDAEKEHEHKNERYTVSFIYNDGEKDVTFLTYDAPAHVLLAKPEIIPSLEGSEFSHWDDVNNDNLDATFDIFLETDMTFIAVFKTDEPSAPPEPEEKIEIIASGEAEPYVTLEAAIIETVMDEVTIEDAMVVEATTDEVIIEEAIYDNTNNNKETIVKQGNIIGRKNVA